MRQCWINFSVALNIISGTRLYSKVITFGEKNHWDMHSSINSTLANAGDLCNHEFIGKGAQFNEMMQG
jgi:hypothetical protein